MYTIKVEIHWSDKNFCCGWGYEDFGAIVVTNKTLEGVKAEFVSALRQQIADMAADGDALPEFLAKGEYNVEYSLDTSAIC
jgi:hypothetical protein